MPKSQKKTKSSPASERGKKENFTVVAIAAAMSAKMPNAYVVNHAAVMATSDMPIMRMPSRSRVSFSITMPRMRLKDGKKSEMTKKSASTDETKA